MNLSVKIDSADLQAKVQQLLLVTKGEQKQCVGMMKEVGIAAMADIQLDFIKRARGETVDGVSWKPISPLTALLRRRGRWTKIENAAQLRQRAGLMPIMRETGKLLASISPAIQVSGLSVTVGTNDARAPLLHAGGSTTFAWDEEKAKRLDNAVKKVLSGHKPTLTPTGRKSRAKKNWNRWYFILRNGLKKASGKSFTVPARPIVTQPNAGRVRLYAQIVAKWIDRILQQRRT